MYFTGSKYNAFLTVSVTTKSKMAAIQKHIFPYADQLNEMSRALGHLCAHIGETGPGEPPEEGEMIGMTLPSRHRIRNSSSGGLMPSTLPLGHGGSPQY